MTPTFSDPVPYNTPEADAIMSAAELFPADNPWNRDISSDPVDPNDGTLVYSSINYYRKHKRAHLDPGWAREWSGFAPGGAAC